jgi:multidrug transporter EmrE-like cation transporter
VTVALAVGLVCALGSALGTNLSFLFKHRGAVAAADVDMQHPLRSAGALFKSKWFALGWGIAVVAFAAHAAALSLLPLSLAQAVLSGGFVLLAVLAERYFGFSLGRRQWIGVGVVAFALGLLGVTSHHHGSTSDYSVAALVIFESAAIALGLLFVFSHHFDYVRGQPGVLLGAAAGLGFGISDVAVKAVSGDPLASVHWIGLAICAGLFSFYASARSLQVGEGVAVIAVTSVAANMSAILAGVLVFGDPMGRDALEVSARVVGFVLVLTGAAMMPAPTRAADAIKGERTRDVGAAASPA